MIKTILNSDLYLFKQVVKTELDNINLNNIKQDVVVTMQLPESKNNALMTLVITRDPKEIETIKNFIDLYRFNKML